VLQGERMLLYRHEMEPAAARRIAAPFLQREQEVQARAETRFEDDEALAPGPSGRQGVAGEEHVALLGDAAGGVVIDVAKGLGIRRAVVEPQARGDEDFRHGPSIESAA